MSDDKEIITAYPVRQLLTPKALDLSTLIRGISSI